MHNKTRKARTALWCLVTAPINRVASAMQASAGGGSKDRHFNKPLTAAAHAAMHCSSPHKSRKPSASDTPEGFNRPVHAAVAHVMRGAAACAIMADTAGDRTPCK
jgi:hypothetical protein